MLLVILISKSDVLC